MPKLDDDMIRVKLDKERCSKHPPTLLGKSHESEVTVLWNQQVKNDRTICNKSDVIIRDNVKGTHLITDIAISGDRNVMKNKIERFVKPFIIWRMLLKLLIVPNTMQDKCLHATESLLIRALPSG